MTTIVRIENKGPEPLRVRYYKEDRHFSEETEVLQVGEVLEVATWNGKIPCIWPEPDQKPAGDGAHFYTVPPAHW